MGFCSHSKKRLRLNLLTALGLFCIQSSVDAADEVKIHVVKKFAKENPGEGRCCSGCDDRPRFYDVRDKIEEGFSDIGYDTISDTTNNGVNARDFTDSGKYSWGEDHVSNTGTDWADVAFILTHGSANCSDDYISFQMGDNDDTCTIRSDRHIHFGDGNGNQEMKAFINWACHGGEAGVYYDGGFDDVDGSKFRIWNAFHGSKSTRSNDDDKMKDYIKTAKDSGIGTKWQDIFHSNVIGSHGDRCPVSIVWGSSASKRKDFFRYGGFLDWNDTGSNSGTSLFYVDGCYPDDSGPVGCFGTYCPDDNSPVCCQQEGPTPVCCPDGRCVSDWKLCNL